MHETQSTGLGLGDVVRRVLAPTSVSWGPSLGNPAARMWLNYLLWPHLRGSRDPRCPWQAISNQTIITDTKSNARRSQRTERNTWAGKYWMHIWDLGEVWHRQTLINNVRISKTLWRKRHLSYGRVITQNAICIIIIWL